MKKGWGAGFWGWIGSDLMYDDAYLRGGVPGVNLSFLGGRMIGLESLFWLDFSFLNTRQEISHLVPLSDSCIYFRVEALPCPPTYIIF